MLFVFFKLYFFREIVNNSVAAYTDISRFSCTVKLLDVFALASSYDRGKYLDFCTLRKSKNAVNYLVDGLLLYLTSTDRAVRNAYSCIKQTEVVVNFGNCADG